METHCECSPYNRRPTGHTLEQGLGLDNNRLIDSTFQTNQEKKKKFLQCIVTTKNSMDYWWLLVLGMRLFFSLSILWCFSKIFSGITMGNLKYFHYIFWQKLEAQGALFFQFQSNFKFSKQLFRKSYLMLEMFE